MNSNSADFKEEKLKEIFSSLTLAAKIVALTGAGVSAESGVPTFRGKDGLWQNYQAEDLATAEAFRQNPKLVWQWYSWRREMIGQAKPNAGHYALAELEKIFPNFILITQNIDNLHQRAGSKKVIELHGNIFRARCLKENQVIPLEQIEKMPPRCSCGMILRPDVVWFGENLPPEIMVLAAQAASEAEFFLVIGTSALVYPAAGLPLLARQNGAVLIEINPQKTPISHLAYQIGENSAAFLPELLGLLARAKSE